MAKVFGIALETKQEKRLSHAVHAMEKKYNNGQNSGSVEAHHHFIITLALTLRGVGTPHTYTYSDELQKLQAHIMMHV